MIDREPRKRTVSFSLHRHNTANSCACADRHSRSTPAQVSGHRQPAMGKKQPRGTVTSAIDALEERLAVCKENLETIDWQLHREELSMESRQSLQDEKTMLKERVSRYGMNDLPLHCQMHFSSCVVTNLLLFLPTEHELWSLRKENGRNMVLSLALLSLFLLLYLCWGL
uniref:Coiled-coil domain-containing protein 167 n=1 Tax=Callorhinchus milii TaxID=7868 RepID=A0A4W3GEY0_CALMI